MAELKLFKFTKPGKYRLVLHGGDAVAELKHSPHAVELDLRAKFSTAATPWPN